MTTTRRDAHSSRGMAPALATLTWLLASPLAAQTDPPAETPAPVAPLNDSVTLVAPLEPVPPPPPQVAAPPPPPVASPHEHTPNDEPSSAHTCTPSTPPGHAHATCCPGTHEPAPPSPSSPPSPQASAMLPSRPSASPPKSRLKRRPAGRATRRWCCMMISRSRPRLSLGSPRASVAAGAEPEQCLASRPARMDGHRIARAFRRPPP